VVDGKVTEPGSVAIFEWESAKSAFFNLLLEVVGGLELSQGLLDRYFHCGDGADKDWIKGIHNEITDFRSDAIRVGQGPKEDVGIEEVAQTGEPRKRF